MKMIPAFTNFDIKSDDQLNASIEEYNKAGNTLPWVFSNYPDGFAMNNLGPQFSKFVKTDMGDAAKTQLLQDLQDQTPIKK